jgi:hypothetical protein
MTHVEQPPSSPPAKNNKSCLMVFILPLVSCMVSSGIGLVLGQIGNQIYKLLGDSAKCLALPGFVGLFLITFGISFFSATLLRKWFSGSAK